MVHFKSFGRYLGTYTSNIRAEALCQILSKTSLQEHHASSKNRKRILPGTKVPVRTFPEQYLNFKNTLHVTTTALNCFVLDEK